MSTPPQNKAFSNQTRVISHVPTVYIPPQKRSDSWSKMNPGARCGLGWRNDQDYLVCHLESFTGVGRGVVYEHPPKTNECPLKRDYFNRKCIVQPVIFRGHSLVFRCFFWCGCWLVTLDLVDFFTLNFWFWSFPGKHFAPWWYSFTTRVAQLVVG